MRPQLTAVTYWLVLSFLAALAGTAQVPAAELKLEAQLLWGTDDTKPPPGKDYKPVEPELKKKLNRFLKWKNYFQVRQTNFVVAASELKRVKISEKCEIDVKNLDNNLLEVTLYGKGKEVMKRKQALPRGEIAVVGGDAPNSTAWFVVIKRDD